MGAMMTPSPMTEVLLDDAQLVRESLAGNRDAFAKIVTRYQSLVCSLAYSATGSLSRSEDLAQETFLTAWRRLQDLREPTRLRSWLCGIARNLISNAQRQAGREPAHLAEPMEFAGEPAAVEPSPSEQAISQEEESLLWRALEGIDPLYREPLVLFYRERQSVSRVAEQLELNEDAVRQRLSRGRALLQEKVALLVEGTLTRSAPGKRFALDVMSALPVSVVGLATSSLGSITGKGSAGAKTSALAGLFSVWTVLTGLVGFLGGLVGFQMSDEKAASPAEQLSAVRFWRGLAIGCAVFLLPVFLLLFLRYRYPWIGDANVLWLGLFYALTGTLFGLWAWRHHQRVRGRETGAPAQAAQPRPRLPLLWIGVVTGVMALLLSFYVWDMGKNTQRIKPEEVAAVLARHPDAIASVMSYQDGHQSLSIRAQDGDRLVRYWSRYDATAKAALQQSGRAYKTYVQGRDFEILGWAGRYLFIPCSFILAAGVVILFRAWWARRASAAG